MTPHDIKRQVIRDAPLLHSDQTIGASLQSLLDSGLPALPVVDSDERVVGIFGEREFVTALFPGYLGQLKHAGFVPSSVDDLIERRTECATETVGEHMNSEKVFASPEASDVQLAETFLHHRVLIVPVIEDGRVAGVITRTDFFRALAEKFLSGTR